MSVLLLFFLSETPPWFLYTSTGVLIIMLFLLCLIAFSVNKSQDHLESISEDTRKIIKDTEIIRRITEKNNKADLFNKTTIISSNEFRELANKTKNQ